jgi:hypothetical protein
MKALTLYPEWAFAVCYLGKPIENRTYAPPKSLMGERIAIHAGLRFGGKYLLNNSNHRRGVLKHFAMVAQQAAYADVTFQVHEDGCMTLWKTLDGGVVRRTWYVDSVATGAIVATAEVVGFTTFPAGGDKYAYGWGAEGHVGWKLNAVSVLQTPVPAVGHQRLWSVPGLSTRRLSRRNDCG